MIDDGQLGQELYAHGWRQGSLFALPGSAYAFNALVPEGKVVVERRAVRRSESLVLITQDCDLVEGGEPYVEAMICAPQGKPEFLARVERNSARWFVVDPERRLVAEAKYRVQIAKRTLLEAEPMPWPRSLGDLRRFADWLARRYDRPAVPDEIVKHFDNRVREALDALEVQEPAVLKAFNELARDVRVSFPERDEPPFRIELVILVRTSELSEGDLDVLDRVGALVQSVADGNVVIIAETPMILDAAHVSLAMWERTRPLYLRYLTYQGGEVEGAEPPSRA